MAPSISSAAGTASNGSTITISGTGFGTKLASKAEFYANFQESTGSPAAHTTLSNSTSIGSQRVTVSADATNKRWGTNVGKYLCDGTTNGYTIDHNMGSLALGSKFRIMFWRKSPNHQSTGNWKNIRIWPKGSDNGYPNWYYGSPDISTGGWLCYTENATGVTGDNRKYFGSSGEPIPTTYRLEQWLLQLNSVQNTTNGQMIKYIDNTQIVSDTDFKFDKAGDTNIIGHVYIQDIKSGSATNGMEVHQADIMMDYGWNCVFLGNASTFAACTHLEFQPYTSWSSTNISINFQKQSFASTTGLYLYVIDDNNVASNGKSIASLGGQAAPTVTSMTPTSGALAGGTAISITGTDFSSTILSVKLNSQSCTSVVRVSATSITAVTPANAAGTYDLVVENDDAQTGTLASAYTYQAAPTVTSISPATGALAGGTAVTITGTGFTSTVTGVTLGGTAFTSVVRVSSTSITAVTPAKSAGAYDVVVTNNDTQTGTLTAGFTSAGGPAITSVAPTNVPLAGDTIVILGSGFTSTVTSVTVGGTACTSVVVDNSGQITCVAPAKAAGTYSIVVTNNDAQTATLSSSLTYAAAPTVTSISPATGTILGGTAVTITGTGFSTSVGGVTIAGLDCTSVVRVNSTSVTAVTPAGVAIGLADVEVANSDSQSGVLLNGFTYTTVSALALTSITPAFGNAAERTDVTILGGNFSNVSITVGGVAATNVVTVSSTVVTAKFPALSLGRYDVVVTNAGGAVFGTSTGGFDYLDPIAASYRSMRWHKIFPRFY